MPPARVSPPPTTAHRRSARAEVVDTRTSPSLRRSAVQRGAGRQRFTPARPMLHRLRLGAAHSRPLVRAEPQAHWPQRDLIEKSSDLAMGRPPRVAPCRCRASGSPTVTHARGGDRVSPSRERVADGFLEAQLRVHSLENELAPGLPLRNQGSSVVARAGGRALEEDIDTPPGPDLALQTDARVAEVGQRWFEGARPIATIPAAVSRSEPRSAARRWRRDYGYGNGRQTCWGGQEVTRRARASGWAGPGIADGGGAEGPTARPSRMMAARPRADRLPAESATGAPHQRTCATSCFGGPASFMRRRAADRCTPKGTAEREVGAAKDAEGWRFDHVSRRRSETPGPAESRARESTTSRSVSFAGDTALSWAPNARPAPQRYGGAAVARRPTATSG